MTTSSKQYKHYQNVAQQSLDKYKKINATKEKDKFYPLIEADWQAFIDDQQRLQRYIDHVQDVAAILGFSRELSDKLTYEELNNRVAERFAEVDLAEHAIRELHLPTVGGQLEKLVEGKGKKCDFKYSSNPSYYFESKYTKNPMILNIKSIVKEALEQIQNSIDDSGIGCIWIFTYTQPEDTFLFQNEIMKVKDEFKNIGFDFMLSVQVYGHGLYGDATVI